MSYSDLARLGVSFRPIDRWPGEETVNRSFSPFSAKLGATVGLLERELRALGAKRIVVQVAMAEGDIRLDGFPRANARARHPGIVVAFDSRYGPMKFAVDTFVSWQENLRAIALGMEALRKVDRYGVTKRGEQYTGWRQLTAGSADNGNIETYDQAVAEIHQAVRDRFDVDDVAGAHQDDAIRAALFKAHPDHGGSEESFRRVQRAREVIGATS